VTAMKPMNHSEFSKAIDTLGLTQVGAGRFLVDPRTCRDRVYPPKDLYLDRWLIVQNHVQQRAVHF